MTVESLHVPHGETVWVDSDLQLAAFGVIRIEGRSIALDADSLRAADAPSIELTSPVSIDVPGLVQGGRGGSGVDAAGGAGSSVTLSAPLVLIDGLVQAGDGGPGGAAHDGGEGGDALVLGSFRTRHAQEGFALRAGSGGPGGHPGGSAGDSGAAGAEVPADPRGPR